MPANDPPIVVGVDGSEGSIAAARWAAAVAVKLDTALHLLYALPSIGRNLTESAAAIAAAAMSYQHDAVAMLLQEAAEAVRADHPALSISTEALDIPVDEALIEASRDARLVVLGGDGVTPAVALLVGSTTVSVATHARCPVVVWRGEQMPDDGRAVVVGFDFTPAAQNALNNAFMVAGCLGAPLRVVYSWPMRTPVAPVSIPFLIDWEALEAAEWGRLADAVNRANKRYPEVSAEFRIEPTSPAKALLGRRTDAQLLVVGTRGRNIVTSALLGSTSMNLLQHSRVPVMICGP
ncbi:Universal stress protein/MSMEI_3859 [Mycolicibacterium vanbaalenii]|uniref:Universal stress protein/MSMEI_3859 n=1 Tax=Mycolicibacterium vanbaalenii TaxID=110539 RepID=A0A5S9R3F0_MYCVN|nr:universal stress protein [Mycolicibacterium vanbaalenii]CAA0128618.1 Universal stress protein/MSMEI_3859 [Mycolicibacterium vanbaalenii]